MINRQGEGEGEGEKEGVVLPNVTVTKVWSTSLASMCTA